MSISPSFPPFYDEATDKAAENLRLALPLIRKNDAPANPVNYAVWYEYVSGNNADLSTAIDELTENSEAITANISQSLYEKYVLMDMPKRLKEANTGLNGVVNNALNNINDVESKTNQCLSNFKESQAALKKCDDIDGLKALVGQILSNTKEMSQTSEDLKESLESSVLEIEKLKDELNCVKKSAERDSLTDLLNRGAFDRELQAACEDDAVNVALLLFDLDHFKAINDNFGHLLGDKVIRFFASLLKKQATGLHLAARYGGEEMAMILFNLSQQEAFSIAEKVRAEFANSRLKKRGSDESIGQVTVSVGISMKRMGDSPLEMIDRADTVLFQSKKNGRNTITVAL
ncbi:MAG: GGDEF domain-containing protein [Gammaproteobacteria bacterium]|nr:MAG: GGDEF domain-containing protein [Gammaproteobacteria bacterium]